MLDHCLKQSFRINRLLGFSSLFFITLEVQELLSTRQDQFNWLNGSLLGVCLLISTGFMLVNELGLKTFKSVHRSDTMIQEKLSVALPLVTTAYLALNYLLLGQVGALFLLGFAVLIAQLLGHVRLARVAIVALSVLFFSTLLLGYPDLITIHIPPFPASSSGVEWLIQIAPFLLILFYHHQVTTSTLFATQDKVIKLQSLAATDGLTGLINRRQFNYQLHSEIARARRHKQPLSLALFDIDDFKKVNDMYGHPVGDRILKELGQLILQNVRESDTPARYGGEEFALILPETRQAEAHELLERLRCLIERTVFCLPDNPMTSTISVGVSQLDFKSATVFELVESADTALYEAKKQGKNRVVFGVVPTPKLQLGAKAPSYQLQEHYS